MDIEQSTNVDNDCDKSDESGNDADREGLDETDDSQLDEREVDIILNSPVSSPDTGMGLNSEISEANG
jgi:hypothetical protein